MLKNIEWLGHSTIKINNQNQVIYIDPYNIKQDYNNADIIFITHSHYDHFSEDDIRKVQKEETVIIITEDLYQKVLDLGFIKGNIFVVRPNESYKVHNIKFDTIPSYNVNKKFHQKENNWVGYVIDINGVKYYIAGDTDINDENKMVKCDVAFLPVGGTYTMDFEEAANLANIIEPKLVVPIHYGSLVGTLEDAKNFKQEVKETIKCEIMQSK